MKDDEFFKDFKFCCGRMAANVTLEVNLNRGQVITYDPTIRGYSVCVIKQKNAISPISYCPYCGKKLPSELEDTWVEVIRTEFGRDYFCESDGEWFENNLPEEFKTDEWWKKRGL